MKDKSTFIKNPTNGDIKRFTFDYSYWSHDGFIELEDGQLKPETVDGIYADQVRLKFKAFLDVIGGVNPYLHFEKCPSQAFKIFIQRTLSFIDFLSNALGS